MPNGSVVLAGRLSIDCQILDATAAEFGWSFEQAESLRCLAGLNQQRNIIAVLFSTKSLELSWAHALRSVQNAAPGALPIICHGFSEQIDWPQAATAGAFHSLFLPFKLHEVRQSFGFASTAKRRMAAMSERRIHRVVRAHAAGIVA